MREQGGGAVFPGRSGSPIADSNFAAAPAKANLDTGSPHGWRSVFRDWASDTGRIDRDLAEAALAHSLGAVEGAYRRLTPGGRCWKPTRIGSKATAPT